MSKFSWICQKSKLEDTSSLRWRIFIEMGNRELLDLLRKHIKVIGPMFKNAKISSEDLESLRDTVQLFNDESSSTSALAWALAVASYHNELVYNDMWKMCLKLATRVSKKFKKGKGFPATDSMCTQDILLTALATNIVLSDIDTISIEEADKRASLMSIICEQQNITVASNSDDTYDENDEVIEELYYIILVQSYQFVHNFVSFIQTETALETALKDKTAISKELKSATKVAEKLQKELDVNKNELDKAKARAASYLTNNKLCVLPCDHPSFKSMQQDLFVALERFAAMKDNADNLTISNMDLKEQLDYYEEVNKVIMSDYMSDDANELEDIPDEVIRARLHGYRIVIYGGHERWKTAMKNYLDLAKIHYSIETSFSAKQRTTDIVIYNMCSMSHADYWNYLRKTSASPVKTNLAFLRGTGRFKLLVMSILDDLQNNTESENEEI